MIVDQNSPSAIAVENVFYAKNVKSMMKLGHARGMALLCAAQKDIPLYEYSPRKVKQAVTGNGNASKEQVAKMLQSLLNIKDLPEHTKWCNECDGDIGVYFLPFPKLRSPETDPRDSVIEEIRAALKPPGGQIPIHGMM